MAEKNEKISDATKDAEQRDAHAAHTAGDRPTPEESAAAEKKGKADPKAAEARDAKAMPGADQILTKEEAEAADSNGGVSPEAAEAYEEYLDTAKDAKGEGRIP